MAEVLTTIATKTHPAGNKDWRARIADRVDYHFESIMDGDNLTVVRKGTILGRLSTGKVVPSAVQDITSGGASATSHTLRDASAFNTGDEVNFCYPENTDGVSITVSSEGAKLNFKAPHSSVEPAKAPTLAVTVNSPSGSFTVNTFTIDGDGNITLTVTPTSGDTVADLLADLQALAATSGTFLVDADYTAGASTNGVIAASLVTGPLYVGVGAVLGTKTVTVNKTTNVISWTGALNLSYVTYCERADGSQTPIGILDHDVLCFDADMHTGDITYRTPHVVYVKEGYFDPNKVPNYSAKLSERLESGTFLRNGDNV